MLAADDAASYVVDLVARLQAQAGGAGLMPDRDLDPSTTDWLRDLARRLG